MAFLRKETPCRAVASNLLKIMIVTITMYSYLLSSVIMSITLGILSIIIIILCVIIYSPYCRSLTYPPLSFEAVCRTTEGRRAGVSKTCPHLGFEGAVRLVKTQSHNTLEGFVEALGLS